MWKSVHLVGHRLMRSPGSPETSFLLVLIVGVYTATVRDLH